MKKTVVLSSILYLCACYSANAQISVTFGEPGYVERYPPTVYSPAYPEYYNRYPQGHANHGHHHNDWSYWAQQRRDHDGDDHHNNGNHDDHDRR